MLKKRPILTQTATATSLAGLGDLIVQMSSEKAFNTTKFLGFTAYAGAYSGPLMHFWFGFLARRFHSFPKMKAEMSVVIAPIPWCEYGSDAEILRLESAWFHTDDDTHIRE